MYPFNATVSNALIDRHQRDMREAATRRRLARQARQHTPRRPGTAGWRGAIAGLWTGVPTLDSA